MKELTPFNLKQLSELLQGETDRKLLDSYISQNLIVARNPPVARLLSKLSDDTYVLPEMRVMVLKKGFAQPMVNLMERRFEAGQVIFLSHNSIVRMGRYSDEIEGFGLSLTDELVSLAFPTAVPNMLDGHVRDFNLSLPGEEIALLEDIHSLLYSVMQREGHSSNVVLQLAATFLWQVNHYYSLHENDHRNGLSREQRLFADFVQLVSQYAAQHHTIDFYAQRLFLSPRYMSTLVKQVSGKAAKQWIDDAIATRIKVELRHSDKSISQIAYEMNFPNPSFFCKYFRRITGLTPMQFRGEKKNSGM